MRNDALARLHESDRQGQSARLAPTSDRFVDADITGDHVSLLVGWCGAGVVVMFTAWITVGGWAATGCATAIVATPVTFVLARSGRRSSQIVKLLPDVVDMLGRSLRSGASLRSALTEASIDAPPVMRAELGPVTDALLRGQSAPDALRGWVRRTPLPEVRVVGAALSLACEHEAGTTQALEGVSQSLRARIALVGEIKALTAQASVSMQALVVLPVGFLLIDAVGDQQVLRFLTQQRLGQACLVLGMALNLAGWLWMRALIRSRMPR